MDGLHQIAGKPSIISRDDTVVARIYWLDIVQSRPFPLTQPKARVMIMDGRLCSKTVVELISQSNKLRIFRSFRWRNET